MKPSNLNLSRIRVAFILAGFLSIFMGCELYEAQTYELTSLEMTVQERFADTLNQTVDVADLRIFGPAWTAVNADANLHDELRIGKTWYDDDMVIRPDVYIFKQDTNIVAALALLSFVYDADNVTYDSIRFAYMYDADMDGKFTGNTVDTLYAFTLSGDAFLQFSSGMVAAADAWDVKFSQGNIYQATGISVMRREGSSLGLQGTIPAGRYLADGSGYDLVMDYLESDSVYLDDPDSLQIMDFGNANNGFFIWDRSAASAGIVGFYLSDVMTVNIWNQDVELLTPMDESISMQAIAYINELKTTALFELSNEVYLVQLVHHENVGDPDYKLALVEGE